MSYIVKNCPCLKSQISYKDKLWINGCSELGEVGSRMCCQDITDCVIKQVIQTCNEYSDKWEDCDFSNGLSGEILKLFDLEEINK